jgi:multidrug efflux pump
MRQAIGVAVFFGMLGVTAFGLVLTPVFYVLVRNLVESKQNKAAERNLSSAAPAEA